jgi:hypothetical protein
MFLGLLEIDHSFLQLLFFLAKKVAKKAKTAYRTIWLLKLPF